MKKAILFLLMLFFFASINAQVTTVTFQLKPLAGGADISSSATLTDTGWQVSSPITLMESSEYELRIDLGDEQGNYASKADQIAFYFFPDFGILDHAVEILDRDNNDLPIGFLSMLTTACVETDYDGSMNIVLGDFGTNKTSDNMITDGDSIFSLNLPFEVLKDASAPPCENEEEIITDVLLTWTSLLDTVIAQAQDPDGDGPLDLQIIQQIELLENTEYKMAITVLNAVEGEDITEEISAESDELRFF